MRNKLIIIFPILIIIILVIVNSFPKSTLSVDNKTYTVEELQNYIVSTGLSYYYNNKYTDYDGYWADESHSEYAVMYNLSPEMISRSKYMTTQCDAFVVSSYLYSLGFDFSKYKSSLLSGLYTSYYNNSGQRIYAYSSDQAYKNTYKYFYKLYSVSYMNKIARDNKNDPMVVLTYQKGLISTIEGVTDTSKTVTELLTGSNGQTILNKIVSKLQPGDIILNDGHAMLWVGDVFEPSGGILHSTAVTSKMTRENGNITAYSNGYEDFDVRYSSASYLFRKGIIYHGDKSNDAITILRPINSLCTINNGKCTLNSNYANVVSNSLARNKLKRLRVEQFVYDKTGDRILGSDSASVNKNDEITYYIYLTNKSNFSFCTSGVKAKESDCKNTGYCSNANYTTKTDCEKNKYIWTDNNWITINKPINYNNITIKAQIPANTTFSSCNYNCKYSNGVVTWNNVSIPSTSTSENKYGFSVKVSDKASNVQFNGMTLTYDNTNLQMGPFKTLINSTVNGKYATEFKNIINNDISSNNKCSSSINYALDTYKKYLTKSDDKTKHVYSLINTDLSKVITVDNIVNGIFKEVSFGDKKSYTKKTSTEVNKLTGNYKIINQMLVPGFYGGYNYNKLFYDNNMDYFNKIKPLWSSRINLNVGDIIVTLKKDNNTYKINNVLMYDGLQDSVPTYVYCENNKVIRHRIRDLSSSDPRSKFYTKWYANNLLIYELYISDLYVVLRPSMYYDLQYRVDEVKTEPSVPTQPETQTEQNPPSSQNEQKDTTSQNEQKNNSSKNDSNSSTKTETVKPSESAKPQNPTTTVPVEIKEEQKPTVKTPENKDMESDDKNKQETTSNETFISNINIDGVNLNFTKDKYSYVIKTDKKKLDFVISLDNESDTYEIIGNDNLKDGSIVRVVVKSQNGNEKEYSFKIENKEEFSALEIVSAIIILLFLIYIVNKKRKTILR